MGFLKRATTLHDLTNMGNFEFMPSLSLFQFYYPPSTNVVPDFVRAPSPCENDYHRIQLEIWRQRMAMRSAPLAEFDTDTHVMPLIHTAV